VRESLSSSVGGRLHGHGLQGRAVTNYKRWSIQLNQLLLSKIRQQACYGFSRSAMRIAIS